MSHNWMERTGISGAVVYDAGGNYVCETSAEIAESIVAACNEYDQDKKTIEALTEALLWALDCGGKPGNLCLGCQSRAEKALKLTKGEIDDVQN